MTFEKKKKKKNVDVNRHSFLFLKNAVFDTLELNIEWKFVKHTRCIELALKPFSFNYKLQYDDVVYVWFTCLLQLLISNCSLNAAMWQFYIGSDLIQSPVGNCGLASIK